jgi:hypothetical protein
MHVDVRDELYIPIISKSPKNSFYTEPSYYIYPAINGKQSNYFEWLDAGSINIKKELSVMDSKDAFIKTVNYGYNEKDLFFLFKDGAHNLDQKTLLFVLNDKEFTIPILHGIHNYVQHDIKITFAYEKYMEVRVHHIRDFYSKVNFKFKIFMQNDAQNVDVMQTFPKQNDFIFEFKDLNTINWYI